MWYKNDHYPQFKQATLENHEVIENSLPQSIYTFIATDADTRNASRIVYSLSEKNDYLTIDNSTGTLSSMEPIDRELISEILVTVVATDSAPSPYEKSTNRQVLIKIIDVNDNKPIFVNKTNIDVPETKPPTTAAFQVLAQDADEGNNSRIIYSISSTNDSKDLFKLDGNTGEFIIQSKISCTYDTLVKTSDCI